MLIEVGTSEPNLRFFLNFIPNLNRDGCISSSDFHTNFEVKSILKELQFFARISQSKNELSKLFLPIISLYKLRLLAVLHPF